MKKLALTSLIASTFSFSQAIAGNALELEPSINGDVSASGIYASQEEEDQALALQSEPCIYGDQVIHSMYTARIEQNMERSRKSLQGVEESGTNLYSAR